MQKIITIFILCLFQSPTITLATELSFTLEKHQKYMSTFSGDIDQNSSIHLIFYKDRKTKEFGVKPFFIDVSDKILELNSLTFDAEPTLISYHKNTQILSLIFQKQIKPTTPEFLKQLVVVDINLVDRSIIQSKNLVFKNIKNTIRLPKKTMLLLYKENPKEIRIISVANSNSVNDRLLKIKESDLRTFKSIFRNAPDYINTSEYVEFGSIATTKVYGYNNKLYFDHLQDNNRSTQISGTNISNKAKIQLLQIDVNETTSYDLQTLELLEEPKIKKLGTYFHEGRLFALLKTETDCFLRAWDVGNAKILINKNINSEIKEDTQLDAIKKITKFLQKKVYSPTITVNTSEDNNLVFNLSYVNSATYNYYHDWWFHHNMMFQQQMMMNQQLNRVPGFGPNNSNEVFFHETSHLQSPIEEENETAILKLVLDQQLNLIKNGNTETVRKKIDKSFYSDTLDKNIYVKDYTLSFTTKTIRSLLYLKKTKNFLIRIEDYKKKD